MDRWRFFNAECGRGANSEATGKRSRLVAAGEGYHGSAEQMTKYLGLTPKSIEPVHNALNIAELRVEKGAISLLMPVNCRKQLNDLSEDMATNVDVQFCSDAREALLKAIVESVEVLI